LNSIGVYNYVDSSLNNLLSSWSEPDFYSKYFNGKKLTLINTDKNDGVFTVNNIDIFDKTYQKYDLGISTYTQSDDLLIELIMKTELPVVYTGGLSLTGSNIYFSSTVPSVLKPGVEFVLPSSTLNTNSIVVDSIPTFLGNTNLTYYATQSQVIWENKIYECVQAYTWNATSSITPASASYWSLTTYLPVTNQLSNESFVSTEIHLTTNKLYYRQPFTQSNAITFASAAAKYVEDFKYFNIDLYYKDYKLHADLIYPSLYAQVNFYTGSVVGVSASSIGVNTYIYEQNVGILETLKPEVNKNVNTNFNYNIVFTDLDEFGIKIKINGHEYQEEIDWIYVGLNTNLARTIDRTLRNWLVKNYARLVSIGIIPNLQYIGSGTSIYYNSINLRTEYPNVPLQFTVEVGTTADFYIEHTEIIFNDMSNYLSININGKAYDQSVTVTSGIPDINTALTNWVDTHSSELDDYGIYVSSINSMLIFRVKKQSQRLDYTIQTGKSSLPGIDQYKVIKKIRGNFGATITSNEIVLPKDGTYSFEDNPFATGQIVAINNTKRPYDNQEYNILYLGPTDLVLSYQGPFWGTTDPRCDVSPFVSIAFNGGFGATGCLPVINPPLQLGGNFTASEFTQAFNIYFASTNNYFLSYYLSGNSNIIDILYSQLTGCMYILGDSLTVMDSTLAGIITTISLPGVVSPISITLNPVNNYLYCLTSDKIFVIDPIINTVYATINLTSTANSCSVNTLNGDIYITYGNMMVDIWSSTNFTSTKTAYVTTSGNTFKMVFNEDEGDMYVIQDNDLVIRIDGSTRVIQSSYGVSGLLTTSIFYEPVNSLVYVFGTSNLISINNGVVSTVSSITTEAFNDLIFNNVSGNIAISQTTQFSAIDLSGGLISSTLTGLSGYLALSQYDGDVYLASQTSNQIIVLDTVNGAIKHTESVTSQVSKLIYDPDRNSMFGIQPGNNSIVELGVVLNSTITVNNPTYSTGLDNSYGTLHPDYVPHDDLWLTTREYLRRPRENYNDDPSVQYVWKWETDQYPQMFLYDFSGSQLPISGSYAYTGPKPLPQGVLNKKANTNLDLVSDPAHQQTIFSKVTKTLSYIDDSDDISTEPTPLELFIGFKAEEEGPVGSILQLVKKEAITTVIDSDSNTTIYMDTVIIDGVRRGILSIDNASSEFFTGRGLKPQQIIEINLYDLTNSENQYVSENHNSIFIIKDVYSKSLVLDFVLATDTLFTDQTAISNYPSTGLTTYLRMQIKVKDREIARLIAYGQTEEEDERFKIELGNVGKLINPDEVFIFKEYDILEGGIDWTVLNRKRKEMLMMKHLIYPYIGAYKSIINAINYFGYNDLQLNEYYRNINQTSPEFLKLFKVEIPDIFDNTVEGWTENDYIKNTYPNENYEETNLFNLTYFITDKEGNITLNYTIDEVIIKLQGLKYWLKKNIIPLTHNILDITGKTYFTQGTSILHKMVDVQNIKIKDEMTPVTFKLNESYLMPVNSGSTVYNCVLDFYSIIPDVGAEIIPTRFGLKEKPKAYYDSTLTLPDTIDIKIRTYKTYKEWAPFVTYNTGDKVTYYGKLYESVIDSNRVKSPRRFENTAAWSANNTYQPATTVNYDRDIFVFSGLGSTQSTVSPNLDTANWLKITEWKQIDFEPVQTIAEFREGTNLLPFNFTIDSNIDPFLVIEVTSDNGYGEIFRDRKNYEIRGLKDLQEPYQFIDPIGPFVPITPVY
jgi:hypothetical protein